MMRRYLPSEQERQRLTTSHPNGVPRGKDIGLALVSRAFGIGRSEQADAATVDRNQRHEIRQIIGFRQSGTSIIEDQPAALEADSQHRMILVNRHIAYQQNPEILLRDADIQKYGEFLYRVVLAVPGAGRQGLQGGTPHIGNTVPFKVADITDRLSDL